MTATPARHAALRTLRAVRAGALADHALENEAHGLPPRERTWTQELVYGALRLRGRLDHLIKQAARGDVDAEVQDVLRLGLYQLIEMDSVPAYAAVSESVELTKDVRARAAGFVNGVLQRLARDGDRFSFPNVADDPVGWLTTWGSHPEWLVRRWLERFGAEATRTLVELDNARPDTFVHTLGDPAGAARALDAAGVRWESVRGVPESLRLSAGGVLEALAAARVIVQDPAATLVSRYLSADAKALVADLCAAPGGKTAALATATPAPAYVIACDVAPNRARLVRHTIARLGLRAAAVVADARRPPLAEADAVLLDAPCTGSGTLRRHPDARWRLDESDIASLAALQTELLDAAARIVRPGGTLVYATCSLEAEENEDQVIAFLERHPDFRSEPPASFDSRFLDARGWLRVSPHQHGFDGAFAARLRRD